MRNKGVVLLALGLTLPVVGLQAQDSKTERPNREGRGPGCDRPMPGLFGALDANSDRKLDKTEIAGAADALKKLDKNSDGKLAMGELRGGQGRGPAGEAGGGNRGNRGPRNENEERAGERPRGEGANRPGGPGGGPLAVALDANKDGSLDADEIKGATAALGKLDKNSDGELTIEEVGMVRGRPGAGARGEGDGQGNRPRGERKAGDQN